MKGFELYASGRGHFIGDHSSSSRLNMVTSGYTMTDLLFEALMYPALVYLTHALFNNTIKLS